MISLFRFLLFQSLFVFIVQSFFGELVCRSLDLACFSMIFLEFFFSCLEFLILARSISSLFLAESIAQKLRGLPPFEGFDCFSRPEFSNSDIPCNFHCVFVPGFAEFVDRVLRRARNRRRYKDEVIGNLDLTLSDFLSFIAVLSSSIRGSVFLKHFVIFFRSSLAS